GIGNPWTVTGLKGIVSLIHPGLIFLSETRCTSAEMAEVKVQLGWRNAFAVDCKFVKKKKGKGLSRAGGLCLLWKDDVKVELQTYSDSHIDVVVGEINDPKRWRFTGLYGKPKMEDRHKTWLLLRQLSLHGNLPWVIGGDFNEISSALDKMGGVLRRARQMAGFQEALEFCNLGDIKYVGPRFTWRGKRGGEEVKIRLDKFVGTDTWKNMFPGSL
ncbi:hypothetical protein ABKV19_008310, partial [Rosa sericea]